MPTTQTLTTHGRRKLLCWVHTTTEGREKLPDPIIYHFIIVLSSSYSASNRLTQCSSAMQTMPESRGVVSLESFPPNAIAENHKSCHASQNPIKHVYIRSSAAPCFRRHAVRSSSTVVHRSPLVIITRPERLILIANPRRTPRLRLRTTPATRHSSARMRTMTSPTVHQRSANSPANQHKTTKEKDQLTTASSPPPSS